MTAIVAALLISCAPALSPAPPPALSPAPSRALSPSASPEVSPDLSAGTPGLVTGQLRYGATVGDFQEGVEVAGGRLERVRVRTATSEMNDARLSGTVTVTDNADRFIEGPDTFLGDVLWGTIVIENDRGTWTGPLTGTTDHSADGRGVTYIELVGAGAYEGLSAILFEREEGEPPNFEWDWNGVIFSGNLPPDR